MLLRALPPASLLAALHRPPAALSAPCTPPSGGSHPPPCAAPAARQAAGKSLAEQHGMSTCWNQELPGSYLSQRYGAQLVMQGRQASPGISSTPASRSVPAQGSWGHQRQRWLAAQQQQAHSCCPCASPGSTPGAPGLVYVPGRPPSLTCC